MSPSHFVKSAVVLVVLACAACDSPRSASTSDASVDAGGSDDASRADLGMPTEQRISASIGPIHASPGEENTVCVTLRLSNATPVRIKAIRTHINAGSHHMILHKSDATEESLTPTPCRPFIDFDATSSPLFIAQQPETALEFPPGVAYALGARQMVRIELHYVAYLATDVDVVGSVDLVLAADGERPIDADLLFWGNADISLAPHAEGVVEKFFVAPTPTRISPDPVTLFALTSHTHARGELATIEWTTSMTAPGELLHESTSWAEPPLTILETPRTFASGEGLRLRCQYFNDTDATIGFGEDFDQEMCFLWGYYYPSQGFLLAF